MENQVRLIILIIVCVISLTLAHKKSLHADSWLNWLFLMTAHFITSFVLCYVSIILICVIF